MTHPQASLVQGEIPCGISSVTTESSGTLIVGGTEAEPGQFPYQVALVEGGLYICGGVIIDARHILTAAHCVKRS